MSTSSRNRLTLAGALWGLLLALLPAALAFDGLALSPFLLAALLLSAIGGTGGALVAGRWAARKLAGPGLTWATASGIGAVQGVVAAAISAPSIWLALTVTMTGFSPVAPGRILILFGDPGIFLQSALAALVVFVYAASVGLLLSPLVGRVILRLLREESGDASRKTVGETS